jgi:hypothetical protein
MTDAITALRSLAEDYESAVSPLAAQRAVNRALMSRPRRPIRRRWNWAVATVGFMAVSNIGLAAAANPSAPGDALYGIDRGYEAIGGFIGFNTDHSGERLDEAETVLGRGDASTAVSLAADALNGTPESATLRELASSLSGAEESRLVLAQVRDLLAVVRNAHSDPAMSGSVAQAARQTRQALENAGPAPDTSTSTSPSDTRPGNGNQGNGNQGNGNQGNGNGQGNGQGNGNQGNGNGQGKGQGNGNGAAKQGGAESISPRPPDAKGASGKAGN